MSARAVVLHYAEVGLKGGNRGQFERRLRDRLRQGLTRAGLDLKVSFRDRRFVIDVPDEAVSRRVLAVVTRIPGIAHAQPAVRTRLDLEAMGEAALALLSEAPPGRFKVETRRGNKAFPLTSIQVSQQVAAYVGMRSDRPADVRHPDLTVRVHVGIREAFVSAHKHPGPGGLPVGSGGHLLAFLSGGLDSPVALWKMLRRGARVSGLHFHNRTQQGTAVLEKLEDLCGVLAWPAGRLPLLVVPFEVCQRAIVATVPAAYRMIVYRRAMFRIAGRVARQERALGFVTGDSLGQVASQTAENLRTIQAAAELPVYTPLIGSDKVEIVDRARQIGTYEISIRPHDDCCSFLIASHPATRSTPEELDDLEAGLDWDALVEEAFARLDRRVIPPDPGVLA